MKYNICRQDGAVWAGARSESANASLWPSGTANISLAGGQGSEVDLWEHGHAGPGCVDRVIDRAVKVASAVGWPAPSADEWATIFVELKRLLDEADVPDKTAAGGGMTDLVRYSWALHSTLYAADDPAAERGHIEAETPTEARDALHSSFAGRDAWVTIWHPDGTCVSNSKIAAGGGR